MIPTTEFGKEIGKRLVDLNQTNAWLINQVRERTGLYFDSSYLHRIKIGTNRNHKVVSAIREVLSLPEKGTGGEKNETSCNP